jgi:excisionase family DNA binding protein
MSHLTIREASQLIGRTSATIRRYIRSGRLKAEKEIGKFGEEYRILRDDLLSLGMAPAPEAPTFSPAPLVRASSPSPPAPVDAVPIALYNELLMKHEQILVQYGMIRAGGQKLLEYKADAELKTEEIQREKDRYQTLRQRALREIAFLRKRLREMEIKLEERNIEITVLQEQARRRPELSSARPGPASFEASLIEIRRKEKAIAELGAEEPRPAPVAATAEGWSSLGFPPLDRKEEH